MAGYLGAGTNVMYGNIAIPFYGKQLCKCLADPFFCFLIALVLRGVHTHHPLFDYLYTFASFVVFIFMRKDMNICKL